MQLRLIPIIALLAIFSALPAAAQHSGDQLYTATRQQLDVTKVVLAQEAAWNRGDMDAYLSFYKDAADTQAILGSPVRGFGNIRGIFRLNFPNRDAMGVLENSEVEVRALGENFALITGKYHLARARKSGGDTQGSFADVLEKTAAGWKIIFSETT